MSYTQFGYSSYTASAPLVLGSSSGQSACYERTGVSPELYPRLPAYAPAYNTEATPSEAPPFYAPAPLTPTYGMKESGDPWRSISQSASYYYDPTLAAYGYGGLDFNGARRKNVTRDSTSTLKAWLNEHRKNPYPTKGEKIMLAIITKMTLTQVSTWFANARRRLKKENKMTWEPRNKAESHEDEGTKREDDGKDEEDSFRDEDEDSKPPMRTQHAGMTNTQDTDLDPIQHHRPSVDVAYRSSDHLHQQHQTPQLHPFEDTTSSSHLLYTPSSHSSSPDSAYPPFAPPTSSFAPPTSFADHLYKPKIWSLADTATNHQQGWAGKLCQQSSCAAATFGGRYGFGLQTDTPPQTPPNMKGSAHNVPSAAPSSYIDAYMGQQSGLCQAEAQLQDDKLDTFPSSHVPGGLPQGPSSSNQNTASDCMSEDFDDSQYAAPSVVR